MAFDWGTAFSIGSSLLGGKSSGRRDAAVMQKNQAVYNRAADWRQRKWQAAQNRVDRAEVKRQFNTQVNLHRNTIRHRVEDAKAAGIHPLYALGASSSVSPVQFAGGSASPGTGVSAVMPIPEGENSATTNAVLNALSQKEQRKYQQAALQRQAQLDQYAMRESYWRSRKDEALAMEALSNAARARSEVNQNQDGSGELLAQTISKKPSYPTGETEKLVSKAETSTNRGGSKAAINPLWDRRLDENGNVVYFLNKEELDLLPALIGAYKTGKHRLKKYMIHGGWRK
jgi:hypothetical protein